MQWSQQRTQNCSRRSIQPSVNDGARITTTILGPSNRPEERICSKILSSLRPKYEPVRMTINMQPLENLNLIKESKNTLSTLRRSSQGSSSRTRTTKNSRLELFASTATKKDTRSDNQPGNQNQNRPRTGTTAQTAPKQGTTFRTKNRTNTEEASTMEVLNVDIANTSAGWILDSGCTRHMTPRKDLTSEEVSSLFVN